MTQDTEQSNFLDFYNRYNSKKNVLVVQKGIVVATFRSYGRNL